MDCIVKACVHDGGCRRSLGECGAAFALRHARRDGGYLVMVGAKPNLTVEALVAAKLVRREPSDETKFRTERIFAI